MIFKGKYKDIIFIFLVFSSLYYFIRIYQNYKFSEFLVRMSVDYQIGQRLMVAPEGYVMTGKFRELLEKYHVGNIKIYGHNFQDKKQLYDLIRNCQNTALADRKNIPLLVATDQEGGWIAHLRKGFTIPPSNQAIGRTGKRHYAYLAAKLIATELKTVGINVNFAPVVDLALNRKNWVIGPRSFGQDPDLVVELASESIKAHLKQDVLPVIKHYPSLGRNEADPHVSFLTNKKDFRTLLQEDLKPFNELLKGYENGLMIGNVSVPSLVKHMETVDKNNYWMWYYVPAVFSPIIIQHYLIKMNHYYGLIFSDEMNIPPVKKMMSIEMAVYRSMKSGVDIVLVSEPPEKIVEIIQYLKRQYLADPQFRNQTIGSVKKILKYKSILFRKRNKVRYFSSKNYDIPLFKKYYSKLDFIDNARFKELNYLLSLNTTDLYRNADNLVPLKSRPDMMKKNFILITSKDSLYQECRKYIKTKLTFIRMEPYFSDDINETEKDRILSQIDPGSVVIMTVLSRKYKELVRAVSRKNRNLIIINLLHKHNIEDMKEIRTILCTYSDNTVQARAAVDYLFNKPDVRDDRIKREYREF
ncbi:MAG: glycoside hydrolase family 3 N-terminal domain-containing protein [bacterium]|nr:glycoside hydrolase family 3 N-terminal domain-containing protein [bacterium]